MSDARQSTNAIQPDVTQWLNTAWSTWQSVFTPFLAQPAPRTAPQHENGGPAPGITRDGQDCTQAIIHAFSWMPAYAVNLLQSSMGGLLELQRQVGRHLSTLDDSAMACGQEKDNRQQLFECWSAWYENGFARLLQLPQLGLARHYQEKSNQAFDKGHRLQMALTEFLHLLCRPIESSLQRHSQCPAWGQAASLAEHPEAAYRQWIPALEGCYLTLFESREYQLSLHKTMQALNEFMQARQGILEDMLKLWPVATHSDLDELTQEVYQLKKLVHRMAKELVYPNP